MNLIFLGKLVNTHGIKGEVRIISDFKYKNQVFKIGNELIINNKQLVIDSYRVHKNYDMVTFKGISTIDEVLKYKNGDVYFDRDKIAITGILNEELIGLDVYDLDSIKKGKVIDIYKTKQYDLIVIQNKRKYMVPYIDEFVKKIDINNKKIIINYIKGLEDED